MLHAPNGGSVGKSGDRSPSLRAGFDFQITLPASPPLEEKIKPVFTQHRFASRNVKLPKTRDLFFTQEPGKDSVGAYRVDVDGPVPPDYILQFIGVLATVGDYEDLSAGDEKLPEPPGVRDVSGASHAPQCNASDKAVMPFHENRIKEGKDHHVKE
jgi:hypothetical protein